MSRFTPKDIELLEQTAKSVRSLDRLGRVEQPTLEQIDAEERIAFELEDLAERLRSQVERGGPA